MSAKHTPGPWAIEAGESYKIRAGHGGYVCTLGWLRGQHGSGGRIDAEEVGANAALLAAAPELLRALKITVDLIQNYRSVDDWIVDLIAKAEGRS
jgi:hypothetical protein